MKSGDGRELAFWKDVPSDLIKKLKFHYQQDLDMFDYTIDKYFKGLKLTISWLLEPGREQLNHDQ